MMVATSSPAASSMTIAATSSSAASTPRSGHALVRSRVLNAGGGRSPGPWPEAHGGTDGADSSEGARAAADEDLESATGVDHRERQRGRGAGPSVADAERHARRVTRERDRLRPGQAGLAVDVELRIRPSLEPQLAQVVAGVGRLGSGRDRDAQAARAIWL